MIMMYFMFLLGLFVVFVNVAVIVMFVKAIIKACRNLTWIKVRNFTLRLLIIFMIGFSCMAAYAVWLVITY